MLYLTSTSCARLQASKLVDLGFSLGITGWLFDSRRNKDLVAAISVIPLDKLMVETDAPYLSIDRRRSSHPKDVVDIARRIAELKGVHPGDCASQLLRNTHSMFGLPR